MCKVKDAIEAASACECRRDIHWADRPITKPFAWVGAVVFAAMMAAVVFGLVQQGVR